MQNLIDLDELYLDKLDCGCHVELDGADAMIVFCPMHEDAASTKEMLAWVLEHLGIEANDAQEAGRGMNNGNTS